MFIRNLIIAIAILALPAAAQASSVQEVADAAERVAHKAQQAAEFHDAFEHLTLKLGYTPQPKAEKSVNELFNEVFPTKSNASRSSLSK